MNFNYLFTLIQTFIICSIILGNNLPGVERLRILVHICCAPCFTSVHKTLTDEGHDIVGYFFNPNIHPYKEFLERLHCLERYTALRPIEVIYDKEYNLDKYLVGALKAIYNSPHLKKSQTKPQRPTDSFREKVEMKESLQIQLKSKEDAEVSTNTIKENDLAKKSNADFNLRCGYCISLRLNKTAEYAGRNDFDGFTTTLLESKYQPHDYIQGLGKKLGEKYGVKFYYKDFRVGWKESIKISKELNLYRQQYCGCIFSEYERFGPRD